MPTTDPGSFSITQKLPNIIPIPYIPATAIKLYNIEIPNTVISQPVKPTAKLPKINIPIYVTT